MKAKATARTRTLPPPKQAEPKATSQANTSILVQHRHTLLEEARNLIQECGLKNFGVRELSKRAGIGHRTIYMLYESKEEIIAAALEDYIEEQRTKLLLNARFQSIDGMLGVLDKGLDASLTYRNYIKAIDTLYFSLPYDPRFHGVVRASWRYKFEQWVNAAVHAGMLKPWVDSALAVEDQLQAEIMLMHDWCAGTLDDGEYRFLRKRTFLMLARAIVVDAYAAAIETALVELTAKHVSPVRA